MKQADADMPAWFAITAAILVTFGSRVGPASWRLDAVPAMSVGLVAGVILYAVLQARGTAGFTQQHVDDEEEMATEEARRLVVAGDFEGEGDMESPERSVEVEVVEAKRLLTAEAGFRPLMVRKWVGEDVRTCVYWWLFPRGILLFAFVDSLLRRS